MKILMAATRFPYPPKGGDTTVCFNRLRRLSERHDITLACLTDAPPSAEHRRVVEQHCDLHFVEKAAIASIVDVAVRGVLTREPLQLAYFHSTALQHLIRRLHQEHGFDVAHIFLLRALNLVKGLNLPCVLDVNDSQTLAIGHRLERAKGLKALALRVEADRIRRLEQRVGGERERVVVLSEADSRSFRTGVSDILPMGIDLPPKVGLQKSATPLVVFSGGMAYYPNQEAALFFAQNCWPAIRQAIPQARFQMIGRQPPPAILALDGVDGVEVVGEVPDMAAALAPAWVAVTPMSVAWGMHTKVLEAMAAGLPVVSTSAAGGVFSAALGQGLFIVDEPSAMSDQVRDLLLDPARSHALGEAARSHVAATYSWSAATTRIEEIYRELTAVDGRT